MDNPYRKFSVGHGVSNTMQHALSPLAGPDIPELRVCSRGRVQRNKAECVHFFVDKTKGKI